jgi:hypothetical protein
MVHGLRWRNGTLPSRAWVIHSFYVPPLRIEFPVWYYFAERYRTFTAGKAESNAALAPKEGKRVRDVLDRRADFALKCLNVIDLDREVDEDSVDYVFTDPPYGGAIQYLELSTLYTAWLRGPRGDDFDLHWEDEITINGSQGKNFGYYHQMLRTAFDHIFRALRPDHYMTVTFHSTTIRVWNSILEAISLGGFDLEKIVYQPPPVKSIKAMMQPYGSAVGDYYIRFHKPSRGRVASITRDEQLYERVIVSGATKIIARRGEPTPMTIILSGIVPELKEANALLKGDRDVADVLKRHVGKQFVLVDARDWTGEVVGKKWWLADPTSVPHLDKVPLSERLERAVLEVLRSEIIASFDEILQKVFIQFPNALTPDQVSIQALLAEYAEKTRDGRWRLNARLKERESQHSRMIRALAELGKKQGFAVAVGKREQHEVDDGLRLGDLASEPSLRLPGVSGRALNRIRQIDVLWYRSGEKIHALFEVENTTGITDALNRASNVPYDCAGYLVLPEERERFMLRKMRDPAFEDRFDVDRWRLIFYSKLEAFWERHRRRTRVTPGAFADIVSVPAAVDNSGHLQLFETA